MWEGLKDYLVISKKKEIFKVLRPFRISTLSSTFWEFYSLYKWQNHPFWIKFVQFLIFLLAYLSTSNMNQSWKHSIQGGGGENYLNVLSVMQSVAAFQRGIGAVLRTCGLPDTIFRKRSQRREKKSNLIWLGGVWLIKIAWL